MSKTRNGRSQGNGSRVVAELRAQWSRQMTEAVRAAVALERRRCADVARRYANTDPERMVDAIVEAIERGDC